MVTVYDKDGKPLETDDPRAFVAGGVAAEHQTVAHSEVGKVEDVLGKRHPGLGEPGGPVEPTAGQLAVAAKRVAPGSQGTRWDALSRQWVRVSGAAPAGAFQNVDRPGPELQPANPAAASTPTLMPPSAQAATTAHRVGPGAAVPAPLKPLTEAQIAAPHAGIGKGGAVVTPAAPPTAGKVFVRRGYALPVKQRIFPNPRATK